MRGQPLGIQSDENGGDTVWRILDYLFLLALGVLVFLLSVFGAYLLYHVLTEPVGSVRSDVNLRLGFAYGLGYLSIGYIGYLLMYLAYFALGKVAKRPSPSPSWLQSGVKRMLFAFPVGVVSIVGSMHLIHALQTL